ncbi:MAG: hypothetical protein OHK0036_04700 [Bacteroidia bacterium]
MQYSDIDYINGIKENNEAILKALYHQYFRMIRHHIITNNGNEADARDIYHETLLTLIHVVKKDNFILSSSLSTFIFAISKRLWLKHLNKNKNFSYSDNFNEDTSSLSKDISEQYIEEYEQQEKNIQKIHIALQSLGNPCYQLLKEFYYNHLSMEQIAEKLGYNNADVAKNQKYKCLQRLKKYFFENTTLSELPKSSDL